jgi:hypothetical protein
VGFEPCKGCAGDGATTILRAAFAPRRSEGRAVVVSITLAEVTQVVHKGGGEEHTP